VTISLEKAEQLSPTVFQRRNATWQDYLQVRDDVEIDWQKISFHQGWLQVDMGHYDLNQARFTDLMTMIFGLWALLHPDLAIESCGHCLIEKPDTHACTPDLVLYKGENTPRSQPDDLGWIEFPHHRLPDLVGEIVDTILSFDLDKQKQQYASLGISEYWVIDVKGMQLFAFGLKEMGIYEPIQVSQVLTGLQISLVEQTLERLTTETNTAAANWLMQQLQVGKKG
jgi:Uma2 family endonuclease